MFIKAAGGDMVEEKDQPIEPVINPIKVLDGENYKSSIPSLPSI
jgi:hypothetical protein